jgi:hypothetical protein
VVPAAATEVVSTQTIRTRANFRDPDQRIADARRVVSEDFGASAGCARIARSDQQGPYHRAGAAANDVCPGRPGDCGLGGPFCRSRPADQFRDRGATTQHRGIHAHGAGGPSRRFDRGFAAAALAAGGIDGGAQSHRCAGDRDNGEDRRRQPCRSRHERRRKRSPSVMSAASAKICRKEWPRSTLP